MCLLCAYSVKSSKTGAAKSRSDSDLQLFSISQFIPHPQADAYLARVAV